MKQSVWLVWAIALAFLTACAGAAPQATTTASATIGFTDTPAPTSAPPTATTSPTLPATATAAPSNTATAVPSDTASPTVAASATVAPSQTPVPPTPKPTAQPTAADFSPTVVQVWNTALAGPDTMQGTCSNPVNPVYGLVQVTPQGDSLIWKNQEPKPYTMTRVRANTWQYSGPTSIGDGNVTMVVQFTSATTLQLTRTFVATAEPNCTHVHHYTGEFQWNR